MSRIDKIKEMLQQIGRDSFLEHALALEYLKLEQNEAALHTFTELLSQDPHYLGSYYHLGKLHEKLGNIEKAVVVFENGMNLAKTLKDMHSYNELRSAYDELIG